MDSFVDKIAQKINAQDMIRANAEAEAAEMNRLKNQAGQMKQQLDQYDLCMQEMRKLNLRNAESAQAIQDLTGNAQTIQAMIQNDTVAARDKMDKLAAECIAKINAIQAEDSGKEEILVKLEELQTAFSAYKEESEEMVHKENVKVYRNVQAAMVEELEKQSQELLRAQENTASKSKGVLPVVIISLIVGLANMGLLIAHVFGIF